MEAEAEAKYIATSKKKIKEPMSVRDCSGLNVCVHPKFS
jgi:hypothetical protein